MALLVDYRKARLSLNYGLSYRRQLLAFWLKNPALLYGLGLFLGFSYNISSSIMILLPLVFLAAPLPLSRLIPLLSVIFFAAVMPLYSMEFATPSHEGLESHLRIQIDNPLSADFLLGIFAGDFHNAYLKQLLGDVGLQHVLAISGFHFSLLALLMGICIKNIIPQKMALLSLMVLLMAYMAFVGPAPSILRALISIEALFLAQMISKRTTSLNRLGIALTLILLYNPNSALHLGFQLSFLATAGIILFYKPIDELLSKWLVRPLSIQEVRLFPFSDKVLFILATFFRKSLALGFAVNGPLLPLLLYYFNQFPLISLFYNLFFPLCVTLSMLLLLLGLFLDIVSLGHWLHSLNSFYTKYLLQSATGLPEPLKMPFYCSISQNSAILLVSLLLFLGILLNVRRSALRFVL